MNAPAHRGATTLTVEAQSHSVKVVSSYDPPPIPTRNCDWSAIDDDTYDGPGSPIGWGRTEAEAIADLLEQLADRDEGTPA